MHAIPPDVLAELEREQMVREAIGHLPPRCREMIEVLFFEHPPMPYNEVARRLLWRPDRSGSFAGGA